MPRLSEHREILRQGRAVEAAKLRAEGWSLADIAKRLKVSAATVHSDLRSINVQLSVLRPNQTERKLNAQDAEVIPLRRQA